MRLRTILDANNTRTTPVSPIQAALDVNLALNILSKTKCVLSCGKPDEKSFKSKFYNFNSKQ